MEEYTKKLVNQYKASKGDFDGDLDIIIGAYGNKYDKNRLEKLEYLKHVQKRLKEEFPIEQVTNDGIYCYAFATNHKVKKMKYFN